MSSKNTVKSLRIEDQNNEKAQFQKSGEHDHKIEDHIHMYQDDMYG